MSKKVGIVVFPGSNCDQDCFHVFANVYKLKTEFLWHKNSFQFSDYDLLVLPGGFSYGDYLRAGAIARFAEVMQSVVEYANTGRPLLGICNGFQILCESGLLPGALVLNKDLLFHCESTPLQGADPSSPFLQGVGNREFSLPIAHGEGSFVIEQENLKDLFDQGQVIMTYLQNPNGSIADIAGITNASGNVIGMMPHPERASEAILGSEDGRIILDSIVNSL